MRIVLISLGSEEQSRLELEQFVVECVPVNGGSQKMYRNTRWRAKEMADLWRCKKCGRIINSKKNLYTVVVYGGLTPLEWKESSDLCVDCVKEYYRWLENEPSSRISQYDDKEQLR